MSVRHATDQPLAAWATAAKPHHFSIGRSLVDEHQTGRIKHALLSNPATARPSDVCSFLLRRAQAFFLKVISCRAKNRQSAVRLPAIRRLRIAASTSFSVKSGCLAIKASSQFDCFSNGEVLPPCGLAVELPASRQRCNHLTAALGLISKCSAASRREAPLSTLAITRSRISAEYGFGIVRPPKAESMRIDSLINRPLGILRFYAAGTCSKRAFLELLAGECQLDFAFVAAREQRDAKIGFQPFDLLAERRGRDVQTLGGACEMQFRRDGGEVTQVADFHRRNMRSNLIK